MSELRRDVVMDDWVIMAPERGVRPRSRPARAMLAAPDDEEHPPCPFCPGNEALTPPELDRICDPSDPARWTVRVVPNRFSAVGGDRGQVASAVQDATAMRAAARGAQEVIIETREHVLPLQERTDAQLRELLLMYRRRVRAHVQGGAARAISVFQNVGANAGASQPHAHSQLIALPFLPPLHAHKLAVARRHLRRTGARLYFALRDLERAQGERMLFEEDGVAVFVPFAARVPYEIWLMPLGERTRFTDASDEELAGAGRALRRAVRALLEALGPCSYNLLLHAALPANRCDPSFLWHAQLLPRTTSRAGFELDTGMSINTVLPEQAAAELRRALSKPRA